jgi:hypothetical protein
MEILQVGVVQVVLHVMYGLICRALLHESKWVGGWVGGWVGAVWFSARSWLTLSTAL